MKLVATALALGLFASTAAAQITVPKASPRVTVQQQVGLATMTLEYSRPGARGRALFGGLVPHGAVWRTGADASTKIGFDRDVQLGGQDVPAGTYALYTIPEENQWTVILSKDTSLWGSAGYDPAEDLLRLRTRVRRLEESWETLTIDTRDFHANGAELFIRWGQVEVAVPLFTDSDSVVLGQIDEQITRAEGEVPTATYWNAAKYYVDRGLDLELAASWVEQAIAQSPEGFWMIYFRAELAQKQGQTQTALQWARRAKEAAGAAQEDFGYVARSQALIDALEDGR